TAERAPLAAEVGILRVVPGEGIGRRDAKRAHERDCAEQVSAEHFCLLPLMAIATHGAVARPTLLPTVLPSLTPAATVLSMVQKRVHAASKFVNLIALILETRGALARSENGLAEGFALCSHWRRCIQLRSDKERHGVEGLAGRAILCCGTGASIVFRRGRIRSPPVAATIVRPSLLGRPDCARSCLRLPRGGRLVAPAHLTRAPPPAS